VVVADGGTFVSNPYKNPTLTILALAWRQAEHVIGLMKGGSLSAPAVRSCRRPDNNASTNFQ
jgi:hypothetical protein